jgi:hypothetical protein
VHTPTLDPDVVIDAAGVTATVPWLQYRRVSTGQTWTVRGTCNQCGLCVVGASHQDDYEWHDEPGRPYAVTDLRVANGRPDEPVVPGFVEDMEQMAALTPTATVAGCSLTIDE